MPDIKAHRIGGDWTSAKLGVLAHYSSAYNNALKNQPFIKGYIDAFAGTGYRTMQQADGAAENLLFPDLAAADSQELLDGSARLALKTDPRFDRYVFIERNSGRCAQLEGLKSEFPELAKNIRIEQGDANQKIQELCTKKWSNRRAVLFLDPYGMQVEWKTLEAVAKTKAIDMWLLFPLGMGVNRLLKKSGDIPKEWREKLDSILGTTDWVKEFYATETMVDLFGNSDERLVKVKIDRIGQYFVNRLKSIFPCVSESPGVLRNKNNNPLYLFCFAAGHEKGGIIGRRIANKLLEGIQ